LLSGIVDKFHKANQRKDYSITKLKERQSKHIEQVMNTMEQSFIEEEERKMSKLDRTQSKNLTFLQRLENQNKERSLEHEHRFK